MDKTVEHIRTRALEHLLATRAAADQIRQGRQLLHISLSVLSLLIVAKQGGNPRSWLAALRNFEMGRGKPSPEDLEMILGVLAHEDTPAAARTLRSPMALVPRGALIQGFAHAVSAPAAEPRDEEEEEGDVDELGPLRATLPRATVPRGGLEAARAKSLVSLSESVSQPYLREMNQEAARLGRSVSWLVQHAWTLARLEVKKLEASECASEARREAAARSRERRSRRRATRQLAAAPKAPRLYAAAPETRLSLSEYYRLTPARSPLCARDDAPTCDGEPFPLESEAVRRLFRGATEQIASLMLMNVTVGCGEIPLWTRGRLTNALSNDTGFTRAEVSRSLSELIQADCLLLCNPNRGSDSECEWDFDKLLQLSRLVDLSEVAHGFARSWPLERAALERRFSGLTYRVAIALLDATPRSTARALRADVDATGDQLERWTGFESKRCLASVREIIASGCLGYRTYPGKCGFTWHFAELVEHRQMAAANDADAVVANRLGCLATRACAPG